MYFVTVRHLSSSVLIKAKNEGNSSKAINYVLYTGGDGTNIVLSEGKSCNLGERRNQCYIFMALQTRYHHLIYDSARAGYMGGVGLM